MQSLNNIAAQKSYPNFALNAWNGFTSTQIFDWRKISSPQAFKYAILKMNFEKEIENQWNNFKTMDTNSFVSKAFFLYTEEFQ